MTLDADEWDAGRESDLPLQLEHGDAFAFCPRFAWLRFFSGERTGRAEAEAPSDTQSDSADEGDESLPTSRRETVEEPLAPPPAKLAAGCEALDLTATEFGLSGMVPVRKSVEQAWQPVAFRAGPLWSDDGGDRLWPAERLGLAFRSLLLRSSGYESDEGILKSCQSGAELLVPITGELLEAARAGLSELKTLARATTPPRPLEDAPKCNACQLAAVCLPDETNACRSREAWARLETDGPAGDTAEAPPERAGHMPEDAMQPLRRRLVAARDDSQPLYLTSHGLQVGKTGELLQIRERGKLLREVRLREISSVNVYGAIQLTTQAVQALLYAGIPVCWFSGSAWFYGLTRPAGWANVALRREQFRAADRPGFCLEIARRLVAGKIANQRTMMRRHLAVGLERGKAKSRLVSMTRLRKAAIAAESLDALMGYEGQAARSWFEAFGELLMVDGREEGVAESWDSGSEGALSGLRSLQFSARNRRPPRDPINAMLSLGYSLLTRDFTVAIEAVGLDSAIGFLHQLRPGRPALALDLMEPFRPLVVDSVVLSLVNQRMVGARDFVEAGGRGGNDRPGKEEILAGL